jgi:hypothetical protein
MQPKPYNGKTKHHGKYRGNKGHRISRKQLSLNIATPIRSVRCWNRSNMNRVIIGEDEINFKSIKDSREIHKQVYELGKCSCCAWQNYGKHKFF